MKMLFFIFTSVKPLNAYFEVRIVEKRRFETTYNPATNKFVEALYFKGSVVNQPRFLA